MEKELLYRRINANITNPDYAKWYNTDKGMLYWFNLEKVWSCRDDIVYDEFPLYWYQETYK